MKAAIFVVLILIVVLLGGIYWNQFRERDERLKREASAESARQKEQARIEDQKKRNEEAIRRGIELDQEAEKKMKEMFGY